MREGIIVDALTLVGLNVSLQVAGVKHDVVVTAAAPPLATADARLGQTLRNDMYTALSLVMNTGVFVPVTVAPGTAAFDASSTVP